MTIVRLTALERMLGVAGRLTSARVSVEYWAGAGPYLAVDGPTVTFPAPITVPIVDGAPVVPLDLEPWGCVRWRITGNGYRLVRYTAIPETGPVDFGDLVDVDPATFEQVVVPESVAQMVTRLVSEAVPEIPTADVGAAVAAYLAAHPVDTGVTPAALDAAIQAVHSSVSQSLQLVEEQLETRASGLDTRVAAIEASDVVNPETGYTPSQQWVVDSVYTPIQNSLQGVGVGVGLLSDRLAALEDEPVAGLNVVGVGQAVFIPYGGTIPAGTAPYTIVIEAGA